MGRNGVVEEDPACRATAAPSMGMAKGYKRQQKRSPLAHGVWGASREGEAMASALQTSQ